MKLLIAALAAAGLSGCAAYVPYYGGAEAYPGYSGYPSASGAAPVYPSPYAYGAYGPAPAYPAYSYGGPSISYGATIVAPRPAYRSAERPRWRDSRDGRGHRDHRDHRDGQPDRSGEHPGWQR